MNIVVALLGLLLFFYSDSTKAEPWMSNRFAQNCAACHAPGRLNRKPSKRRCTLSCQGCHVNPNGGGLRNAYGKWNSERWARSFYTKLAWNKSSPAPLDKQHYAKKKIPPKKKKKFAKSGAKLVGFPGVVKNEKPYRESSNYVSAKSKIDELARMTRNDPYRIERRSPIQAGGDLRFFFIQQSKGAASEKLEEGAFYPMVFDFGIRIRPIKEHLSFVYEGRAVNINTNNPSSLDNLFAGPSFTRSAYVMVDDLWYNTYAQYGFYRPMFGLYNPNHNAMITDYTRLGVRTRVKAFGFGAAPNVPFGIVNYIMPTENAPAGDISAEGGFNLTLGMRFVSFGASINGSYWDTEDSDATIARRTKMWNINIGGVLDRFILNGEMTSVQREAIGLDETKILGVEAKYRVWREMYLQASFAQANAAVGRINNVNQTNITKGSGSEMTFGAKAFIISGLELETLFSSKVNKEEGEADFTEETLQLQMHAYF